MRVTRLQTAEARRDHRPVPARHGRRCCRCCTWSRPRRATSPPAGSRFCAEHARDDRDRSARRSRASTPCTGASPPPSTRSGSAPTRLCAIMGGDQIFAELAEHLRPGRGRESAEHGRRPPPRHQVAGRQGRAGAPGVQRGLRLRAGDDGQLGVLRQPDPGVGPRNSSTTCARASRVRPPGAPIGCAPGSRRPDPRRLRRRPGRRGPVAPARRASVGLKLAKEHGMDAPRRQLARAGGDQ